MLARKPTRKARRRSSLAAKPRRCSAPTVIGQNSSHTSAFLGDGDYSPRRMCRTPQPSDCKRRGTGGNYMNYSTNNSATNLAAGSYSGVAVSGSRGRLSPYPSSLYARGSVSSCSSASTHYYTHRQAGAGSSRRSSARSEDMGGIGGLAASNSSYHSSRRSTETFLENNPPINIFPGTHLSATNPSSSSPSSYLYPLQNTSIPRIVSPGIPSATSPTSSTAAAAAAAAAGENYHYHIVRNNNGHAVTIALGAAANRPSSPHSPLLRPETMHLMEASSSNCSFGTLTKMCLFYGRSFVESFVDVYYKKHHNKNDDDDDDDDDDDGGGGGGGGGGGENDDDFTARPTFTSLPEPGKIEDYKDDINIGS
ncbi:hypothetical protein PoB_000597400 [Plakobranchus ocellatus]|uniref:Uncharacterized protein n=1 Tax=Plakobranchus ocellatus TaxID=259542 RepID=A0AAV3Y952_9GAST|nr:hypothetical protein PoB_000597400 [Plakobranchus ocellatus]